MQNCLNCGAELTGRRRKFCSTRCNGQHWVRNNPERHATNQLRAYHNRAASYPEYRQAQAERKLRQKAKDPEHYRRQQRKWSLRKYYGIEPEEYDRLLQLQNERCAICGTDDPGRHPHFHVDHCHYTNRVRGLLCPECNTGIGKLKDDPCLLRAAVLYLDRSEPPRDYTETYL